MLQPRVTPSLPKVRDGSLFQRVFTSPSGLDPYAFAVSDVYQDLFGEGSYTGKGIYDVDMFEAALAQRIPENTLLSHDLLEESLHAPVWSRTSRSLKSFPRATTSPPLASIAGRVAIGSCCPGFLATAGIRTANMIEARFRSSAAGRCWTTCAAHSRRRCFSGVASRMDAAVARGGRLERIRRRNVCDPCLHPGCGRNRATTIQPFTATTLAQVGADFGLAFCYSAPGYARHFKPG